MTTFTAAPSPNNIESETSLSELTSEHGSNAVVSGTNNNKSESRRIPPSVETMPLISCTVHNYSISNCDVHIVVDHNKQTEVANKHETLKLDLQFPAEEIQPIFSGGCWAGTVVWEAATLLSNYLVANRDVLLGPFVNRSDAKPKVVELGSGVGVPGFVAALLGARVLVTEQEPLDSLLARNAAANEELYHSRDCEVPLCAELDWNDASTGREALLSPKCLVGANSRKRAASASWLNEDIDLILISDCIYEQLYGKSWMLLAKVLDTLMSNSTTVLNSLERRNVDGIDAFVEYAKQEFGIESKILYKGKGPNGEDLELYYHYRSK